MMPGKRRGMAALLQEQKVIEDGDASATAVVAEASPPASADSPAVIPAIVIPAPHTSAGTGELTASEEADLAACERALDNLRLAFASAGKALQVIRDARLYRAEYPNFDMYCEGRWQMHRSYADKLIRAWPLAARLSPIGLKELNEGQVRELLPLAAKQGEEAAVIVYEAAYRAAAEVDGVRITAAVLKGAVGILPDDQFDKNEAISQIREYVARLAEGGSRDDDESRSAADRWAAEAERVRADFHRAIRKAATPAALRELVAELRTLLDEVEQSAL